MMIVSVDATPNPLVRKFSLAIPLATKPFEATGMAETVPALSRLIDAGAVSVFVGNDHFAIGVSDATEWETVAPAVRGAIEANVSELMAFTQNMEPTTEVADYDNPVVAKIMEVLETRIRPAVAHDGGDMRFRAFKDGSLELEMAGACSGCPSSAATLKLGVLKMMRHFVPEVRDVVSVTD